MYMKSYYFFLSYLETYTGTEIHQHTQNSQKSQNWKIYKQKACEAKQENKQKCPKYYETKIFQKCIICLYWPFITGRGNCPYLWFVCIVRLCWSKLNLLDRNCQFKMASGLVRAFDHFPLSSRSSPDLGLCRPCACYHSLCEFI